MLAVAVDDQDELAGGAADAALDRGAVALVVRMADDRRAGGGRACRRAVRRSVVDDDDLVPRRRRRQRGDDLGDRGGFVEGGNDD